MNALSDDLPIYMSAAHIRERLIDCHPRTLKRAERAGKIRGRIFGGRWVYDTPSVLRWIRAEQPPTISKARRGRPPRPAIQKPEPAPKPPAVQRSLNVRATALKTTRTKTLTLFQHAPGHPWRIKLQGGRVRRTFSTQKVNFEEAALVAVEIYEFQKEHGMEATLQKYGKLASKMTIGDLIKKVSKVWRGHGKPRTLRDYKTALRRVVSEIKQVDREQADTIKIADITQTEIEHWRVGHVRKAGINSMRRAQAETSARSMLRSCKAMFGETMLEKLQLTELPNPFAKIRL